MLVKYRPMSSFLSPFESFWKSPLSWESSTSRDEESELLPRADVIERKDDYVIYAEMPGVSKNDFKVELDNHVLTISGRKNGLERKDDEQCFCTERQFGNYRRSFRIGEEVDMDKVNATYENGVLQVVLPKTEKAKPKSVEIKIN